MAGLTARYVQSVQGVPGRRTEYPDEALPGLSLRVGAPLVDAKGAIKRAGVKSWTLRYRNQAGEQRRLTLGGFPALELADARARARAALGAIASGQDVAQDKLLARRRARHERATKPQTLADLWRLYEAGPMAAKRPLTRQNQTWLWTKRIEPSLGGFRLLELDRASVRSAMRAVGKRTPTTANRALALLRHMLNYAVAEEMISASPLAAIGRLFDEQSRNRVLNSAELAAVWTELDNAAANETVAVSGRMAAALKLQLLTACRAGEIAGMHAREIDPMARAWLLPAARTKSGRDHVVPLSTAAWEIVASLFEGQPREWSGYAFPNARHAEQPIERASMTRALSRIAGAAKIEDVTPHDLRRTAATMLASERVGVAPHVVGAVLGHQLEGAAVTAIYNRHRYDAEKRAALEAWGRLVMDIASDTPRTGAKLTPMSRGKRVQRA